MFVLAVPGAPVNLNVKDKKENKLTLTWKPPKHDGGSKVTQYILKVKEGDSDWSDLTKVKAFDTEYRVDNLKPDTPYMFSVAAENSVGLGPAVETTSPTTLKKKPGEPRVKLEYIEKLILPITNLLIRNFQL